MHGIDLSLIGYAYDILNLIQSPYRLETNFIKLQQEYDHIGIQFNAENSKELHFNSKSDAGRSVTLGDSIVEVPDVIAYLGLPVGQ